MTGPHYSLKKDLALLLVPLSPIPSPANKKDLHNDILQKVTLMGRAVLVAWWTTPWRYRASSSPDEKVELENTLGRPGVKNQDNVM
jgi:hypothetical protein